MWWMSAVLGAPPEIPQRVAREAVLVERARASAPFELPLDDFELSAAGVEARWVPGSVEWVRLADAVLVPRARLEITAPDASAARFEGVQTSIVDGRVEVEVALLSGVNADVVFEDSVVPITWTYTGPFRSGRDVSCSGANVRVEGGPDRTWAHVGCRDTGFKGRRGRDQALDLLVVWSGADADGAVSTDTYVHRVADQGVWTGDSPAGPLRVRYRTFRRDHDLTVGLLLGGTVQPDSGRGTAPLGYARVFGRYQLGPTSAVLVYDYANLHPAFFANDAGGYYEARLASILDHRLEIRSLLGAHLSTFADEGEIHTNLGFPQGFEVTLMDAPVRDWVVRGGGFFGPPIDRQWFANTYVRLERIGPSALFIEAGFTGWAKAVPSGRFVDQRLITLSLGGPLFRAL